LLEQIKDFEQKEFAAVASRDTEFKPRLQPLNESGGSALLKIVHIFLLCYTFFYIPINEDTALILITLPVLKQLPKFFPWEIHL